MIGVKKYKDDLRAANARIAELEALLRASGVGTSAGTNKAVAYDVAARLSGTNADKVAQLSRMVSTLKARLRAAGLSAEV